MMLCTSLPFLIHLLVSLPLTDLFIVCPSCSNMLIITRIPLSHCSPDNLSDANKHRFECRTCPYQMILDKKYYDRKTFEFKKAEDVLGGEESWKNVERTTGEFDQP
jgi:DNA-directed RNA polymerase III subunit RPC11